MKRITKRVLFFLLLFLWGIGMVSDRKEAKAYSLNISKQEYEKMVSDSLVSTGNNARIKKVMEKARDGKKVTLAYLGGSITEGVGARPNRNCYAEMSWNSFAKKYGWEGKVDFINAGMSGTPSSLGAIRYNRDVLSKVKKGKAPDILFLEFAVNDNGECTKGGAYEGLIRRAMKSGSAVVLIFSVFRDNFNMQDTYIPYGKYYGLPMVSIKNGIKTQFHNPDFSDWYFHDYWHPTNEGHAFMADCITNLFEKIDQQSVLKEKKSDVSKVNPYQTDDFEIVKMLTTNSLKKAKKGKKYAIRKVSAGGFKKRDKKTGKFWYNRKEKFPYSWKHKKTSSKKPLKLKIKCKNFMVVYKLSKLKRTGKASIFVDGKKIKTVDGYNKDGWNNACLVLAVHEDVAKVHTIEIRMAKGSEKKEFTVLAMGYC
ncbi:MAG: SGNH/GDSL hydrolase family protein [Eubacterium sp.]|nr:SGNH/GDSL hydrolase family protein [Eubacterium sp.]